MEVVETGLAGVVVLRPAVHRDGRGFFVETMRLDTLRAYGLPTGFVQDNQSRSTRGVLRGLHYQLARPQGKLVRVSRGRVFDVAVDIRRGSRNFGRWAGQLLDDEAHEQLYVPPGFAHGFCVLSEVADFVYKCTDYYDPGSQYGIAWNDPAIGIDWPLAELDGGAALNLSGRDRALPALAEQPALPVCTP